MGEEIWTVLVVDDERDVLEQISDLLTLEGFAVLSATNGARALDVLKALPGRCLVLLDLDMPVMTGKEFLLNLAELRMSASRFPVIVVSGTPDAPETARMPSVMAVLKKPYTKEALIAAVREHVAPLGRPMR